MKVFPLLLVTWIGLGSCRVGAAENPLVVVLWPGKPQIIRCMHEALRSAGVLGELHVYASGGHDFALRLPDKPCGVWPRDCAAWMRSLGFLSGK